MGLPQNLLSQKLLAVALTNLCFNKACQVILIHVKSLKITDLEGHNCYSCKQVSNNGTITHIVLELSVPNCVKIICIICSAYIHVLVHAEKYSGNVHGTYYRASGK